MRGSAAAGAAPQTPSSERRQLADGLLRDGLGELAPFFAPA